MNLNEIQNKKIMVISPFNIFPPYWGGANRIYNLIIELSKNNDVILLYNDYNQLQNENIENLNLPDNVAICPINSLKKPSQIFNPLLLLKGLYKILKEKPDYVIAEFVWSGLHAMCLRFLTGTPYILDEHNVEFLRFERMNKNTKLFISMLKFYEKLSCKFASTIYCVSDVDKRVLASELDVNEYKIMVVPNMVNTHKFYPNPEKRDIIRKKMRIDKNMHFVLFFGKLDYAPNYEAVEIIHGEILPKVLNEISNIKFVIVGDKPPTKFKHKNIIYTGIVERIEDYINASDFVICPLTSGGGTRIKILESLACGKTVISTTIGSEGIFENDVNKLKIVDDWTAFAEEIINMARNEDKW